MPQNPKGECGWTCVYVLYFEIEIWFTSMDIPTIKADSMRRFLIPKWKKVFIQFTALSQGTQLNEAGGDNTYP